MKSIDILKEEHKYIKMVLAELRRQCVRIVNGGQVEYELFYRIIDFVRNYADKYHHKKEENHLFNIMSDELGNDVRNGPIMGMLVEHDFGRAHIYDLEKALEACKGGNADARVDVIASALGYEQMLLKHIDKEDHAIYQFAERKLAPETLARLDSEFDRIELDAENTAIRNKYMEFATKLGSHQAVH